MIVSKRLKAFDDDLFDRHPDLKDVLKPNDQYPELKQILNNRSTNLPVGSLNTKVIINDGEIVERIYKTPKGRVISSFSKLSSLPLDRVA